MSAAVSVSSVRFEHHEDGRLGIGESAPRLSWRYDEAPTGYVQTGVDIEVSIERPGFDPEVSLHRHAGPEQVLVAWPARPLRSRERVTVRVRPLLEGAGWSAPSTVEVGLLGPDEWTASFVGPDDEDASGLRRPSRVRAEFDSPADVVRARLYLSAHGLAQAEVNGLRVGDEELTPGWTTYRHRLRYATYDITSHLRSGANAVGIWLADGWWRGLVGFDGGLTDVYGADQSALAQIELTRADGTLLTIASGPDWTVGGGPILSTGLYEGEHTDLRLDDPSWSTPDWSGERVPARVVPADPSILVAPTGSPVRCTGELAPVSVHDRGDGRWLLDFGQNHSGRLRITGSGEAGDTVVLRHAEVLQDDELYTRTLRGADATDRLVLAGGDFTWEPKFTIHGYRYAEISGWRGPLDTSSVVSRVLHTDMERTGWFRSSNAAVNRLHENVVWSARSNFVDLPVDCPQRDERLGWTGDIQVFAPTAAFLFDVTGMLASWLQDLAHDQDDRGTVPFYVPYLPLGSWADAPVDPVAVWGDAAVLTPEVLYDRTGDAGILRRQYASARAWVLQVQERAGGDLICEGTMQLGDWLDPAAPPDDPALATTDPALVATAYFARSARAMARIAGIVGEREDEAYFGDLGERVVRAFAARYIDPDGRLCEETQTALSLVTVFGLWPDADASETGARRLAELVDAAGGRVATGFAGTPVVSDALTLGGHLDEAYRMLLTEECPSWLYTVAMGGTTTWERWDSMLPDGTVNPGDMTSFNHYALGAVADWLHRVVAGLSPAAPGYRRIRFEPRPGGGLTSAGATHRTPYGDASIDWEVSDTTVSVSVVVPIGTTAEVVLPGRSVVEVGPGEHSFAEPLPTGTRTLAGSRVC